jgi:hypothetical protein
MEVTDIGRRRSRYARFTNDAHARVIVLNEPADSFSLLNDILIEVEKRAVDIVVLTVTGISRFDVLLARDRRRRLKNRVDVCDF